MYFISDRKENIYKADGKFLINSHYKRTGMVYGSEQSNKAHGSRKWAIQRTSVTNIMH
jgi:hypothetical protein